jgi:hypothetical protein
VWRLIVGFVEVKVMQQGSNLSGVVSRMLACICTLSNLMLTDPLVSLADSQSVDAITLPVTCLLLQKILIKLYSF